MSDTKLAEAIADRVLSSVGLQLADLQPDAAFIADVAAVSAQAKGLQQQLSPFPQDPAITNVLGTNLDTILGSIVNGKAPRSDLWRALAELAVLNATLGATIDGWISSGKATLADKDRLIASARELMKATRHLIAQRPDINAILDDLNAIKELRGGPADAVAYHDFHVLQMAFKNVWLHAFDANLQQQVEDLYAYLVTDNVELYFVPHPLPDAQDAAQLQELLSGLQYRSPEPVPESVQNAFGALGLKAWPLLSPDQQSAVLATLREMNSNMEPGAPRDPSSPFGKAFAAGESILNQALQEPQSARGRLSRMIENIQKALAEPYAFDVFAPDSYNYGLMVTYRQRWEPGPYQAGDLTATIPLAPGETRRFSRKTTVKTQRAVKEIEKSMSSRATQSSEMSRAEREIMQRATFATNFKMTTNGSFNIGIGSIGATTEFGANQEQVSSSTKRGLHEATLKAAEEYRLERSIEVDTTVTTETEQTSSGEISNPNNEITVTYLFYELQRRYLISEFLYRVRPVILVAQDVPAPDQIDEAWLLQYQWIIARVLLDDSLRPALTYLNSGFAGDELSVEVKRAQWETQRSIATSMEALARDQLTMRDQLRELLVATTLEKDSIVKMPGVLKAFTFGADPTDPASDLLEAKRKAIQTRLGYAETALADAQEKAKQAATAFQQATNDYSAALQNQYNRRVAIDQLRIHVKQNILYYMQAIWDQEPPDQRFFRLYRKKVMCVEVSKDCTPSITGRIVLDDVESPIPVLEAHPLGAGATTRKYMSTYKPALPKSVINVANLCPPTVGGMEHELVEVADLDNPLGYKGNYMIFPLLHSCHLTDYMLSNYIDNYLGLIDPDGSDSFIAEEFEARWAAAQGKPAELAKLREELVQYLTVARRSKDEIIVPTGQLFIEALPGSHPLLEDFKLLHRAEDVRKVKAEVRHAELENLRLASRLAGGQATPELLEDPDIEKKVVVMGSSGVVVGDT